MSDMAIPRQIPPGDARGPQAVLDFMNQQLAQNPHYQPPSGYHIENGRVVQDANNSWASMIPFLIGTGIVGGAGIAALGAGGGAGGAAAGGSLADVGPSTAGNIAATSAAGAAPSGIAAGGGAAAGAGGTAAASTPWWQTALKAGAPLAATAITHGSGGAQSPLSPTMQADIQSLLNLSMQRAQESAPIHQAAMALALHLAPTYAKAHGFPASPLSAPSPTPNPTAGPTADPSLLPRFTPPTRY